VYRSVQTAQTDLQLRDVSLKQLALTCASVFQIEMFAWPPSAELAVLRLITNSNVFGVSTSRLADFK
jgi:hypothetical protein